MESPLEWELPRGWVGYRWRFSQLARPVRAVGPLAAVPPRQQTRRRRCAAFRRRGAVLMVRPLAAVCARGSSAHDQMLVARWQRADCWHGRLAAGRRSAGAVSHSSGGWFTRRGRRPGWLPAVRRSPHHGGAGR